ncbi:alpha/beta fold hydrolase [Mucilaginibacter sp. P25]|uniref:alpha/beta fold hydrolase n=1 Tax=Mucilaginibacter sp. P25 TaxID=3423945 RepID=UPI003D7B9D60
MKIFQINFQTASKYNSQIKQSGAPKRSAALLITVVAIFIRVISHNYVFAQSINKEALSDNALVKKLPGFKSEFSEVNGVKLHYVEGGTGKILVLLPGWPQNWWEYSKVMPELSKKYHLIGVDYRGMGSSDKPANGYDKKTIASDIYGLLQKLGYKKAFIAGHDIGAQVAFSIAANYPDLTEKLIIMDVPHPDEILRCCDYVAGAGNADGQT